MIDFNELRKEVAVQHNVLLGKDDPVLVTLTLHDMVLRHYVEVLTRANIENQKAIAAAVAEHVEASRTAAGKLITDAAEYVATASTEAVTTSLQREAQAASAMLTETLSRETKKAIEAIKKERGAAETTNNTAKYSAGIAVFCAALSIVLAVIIYIK